MTESDIKAGIEAKLPAGWKVLPGRKGIFWPRNWFNDVLLDGGDGYLSALTLPLDSGSLTADKLDAAIADAIVALEAFRAAHPGKTLCGDKSCSCRYSWGNGRLVA